MGVGGQGRVQAASLPGKSSGTHCRGGWLHHRPVLEGYVEKKILLPEEFEHRTLQPVAGRCAEHVILAFAFSHYASLFGIRTMATVYG